MEVIEEGSGDITYFPCGRWLSKDEDDGLVERTLIGTPVNPHDSSNVYKVGVYTSDVRAAGTDANVSIKLIGKTKDSGVHPLKVCPSVVNVVLVYSIGSEIYLRD